MGLPLRIVRCRKVLGKKTDATQIEAFHIEDGYFQWDGMEFG